MRNGSLCCGKQTDLPTAAVITNPKIPTGRTKCIRLDTILIPLICLKTTPSSALVAEADSAQHLILMIEKVRFACLGVRP